LVSLVSIVSIPLYCAAQTQSGAIRCVALEVYLQGNDQAAVLAALEKLMLERPGIAVRQFRPDDAGEGQARLASICQHFKLQTPTSTVVYGCGQLVVPAPNPADLERQLANLVTMNVFVRAGCPRCALAKQFLPRLMASYPGFAVRYFDIVSDAAAVNRLNELTRQYRTAAASVPVFHVCDRLLIGFDSESTSGQRLEKVLRQWTLPCARPAPPRTTEHRRTQMGALRLVAWQPESSVQDAPSSQEEYLPLPGEAEDELPLPSDEEATHADDSITLPLLGTVSAHSLGMPLFTLAVGLVDGFNPCAMWVLLFLLSLLVNLKSRWKMLAVAGTFVVISGLAYFAFMAAWLNVFSFVGLLRPVQITLALLAIMVGLIHVKDFFAFHKGVSLSIPDRAKPGIYARARRIVLAENVLGALAGAMVLAVLVNMIELLCTAGLPALYTAVLSMQPIPVWMSYVYLTLYIVAYMFDDTLMVIAAVATLGRPKMQERHGRALKLLSGTVILVLGIVMLWKPEWLV
jgi:hypothetical protein